jgi:Fe2+ or Zn2+ uptake regulation protein
MKLSETEKYKNILNKVGIKATSQRVELLALLSHSPKPVTLKDLMKKVKISGAHEVTLYRTLSMFKEANIIKQLDLQDSVPYFEILDSKHDHHHIVCTMCKKVNDFVGCGSDNLIKKALQQTKDFKSVTTHSFELFGLCKECSK